jgi:uncharacterized protein YdiU (UPF0061 family)
MVSNPVAITTRVAPSFLRVGQLELFGRRARSNAHPDAFQELKMIVSHLIEREYKQCIDEDLPFQEKVLQLATEFRSRLTSLIADWLRVGYCQGNFNSDNCAAGGYTLDYGPFGYCELFDPYFQPWTGGGQHFCFFNQMAAAQINFGMFCTAIEPLFASEPEEKEKLVAIRKGFAQLMEETLDNMWARKLGLESYDSELFMELIKLMSETGVDYTIFFRELCSVPENISGIRKSFYGQPSAELSEMWNAWLQKWHQLLASEEKDEISIKMKQVNPKYTWREWLIVPAYEKAAKGDYSLIHELQEVLNNPYDEQSEKVEDKYYRLKPAMYFEAGGVSHYSCSS